MAEGVIKMCNELKRFSGYCQLRFDHTGDHLFPEGRSSHQITLTARDQEIERLREQVNHFACCEVKAQDYEREADALRQQVARLQGHLRWALPFILYKEDMNAKWKAKYDAALAASKEQR